MEESCECVILVVGSCGLDRLIAVPAYPAADAKVRTTSYHEMGGGNAANSASAMSLLSSASFLKPRPYRIKLLTKCGVDNIGNQVVDELQRSNVDMSDSFRGGEGTTTSIINIIVSESEQTRTCFHTPGTCGEIDLEDLASVDFENLFQNVVHLHSDSRHTQAALMLALEAKRRGIPVSVDVEKDRQSKDLDRLLEIASMVFTNAQQIEKYLDRLFDEKEKERGTKLIKTDIPIVEKKCSRDLVPSEEKLLYENAIRPSFYFAACCDQAIDKEVVITLGGRGALYIQCESYDSERNELVDRTTANERPINQADFRVCVCQRIYEQPLVKQAGTDVGTRAMVKSDDGLTKGQLKAAHYAISAAGTMRHTTVVDTTGAGDAFIGSYILFRHGADASINTCLDFASWCAGRKLAGPGPRSALVRGSDVDVLLGKSLDEVKKSLELRVSRFSENE